MPSLARRCKAWNSYAASLVPYPAHVVTPPAAIIAKFEAAMRAALQPGAVRWCPLFALTAQGPAHGVQGGPKCAAALAVATGVLAHLSATGWGPLPARRHQAEAWRGLAEWAHSQLIVGAPVHEHHGGS